MRSGRLGPALRFVAPALAAVAVAAAGASVAATAHADPQPCNDAAPASGDEAVCEEETPSTPSTPTATETGAAETAPAETAATTEAEPPLVEPTTTAKRPVPTETPKPAKTPPAAPPPPAGATSAGMPVASAPHNSTPPLSGGPYVFPVLGAVSFADTWGAARATVAWHHGVDIFAPRDAPIVAVTDGVLFSVGWNRIGGRRLWLRDRQGNWFYYAHLSGFAAVAVEGAEVGAGTVIGYVGNTGDAFGTPYHLHFEIHPVSMLSLGYDGAVNPFPYVSAWRRVSRGGVSSASAPAPGAFLLGYQDISTESGLSRASLEQTLEQAASTAAPAYDPDQEMRTPATPIPRRLRDDARMARELDALVRFAPGVWDSLAACESGGNWATDTGNGFSGGLQFHPQTWLSHGGAAFAPSAHLATREEQIAVAERVLVTQGWRAWPACSALLGLGSVAQQSWRDRQR